MEANELKELPSHVLDTGLEPRFYISLCDISHTYFCTKSWSPAPLLWCVVFYIWNNFGGSVKPGTELDCPLWAMYSLQSFIKFLNLNLLSIKRDITQLSMLLWD